MLRSYQLGVKWGGGDNSNTFFFYQLFKLLANSIFALFPISRFVCMWHQSQLFFILVAILGIRRDSSLGQDNFSLLYTQ